MPERQAAEAVRGRIAWKYLLGLKLTDAGFDFSVHSEFRTRLLEGGGELLILDKLLDQCQSLSLVKARGTQRTDVTRVLAAIRVMNRLELVGETMQAALNDLATVAPDWLRSVAPTEWYHPYSAESKIICCSRARRNARPARRWWERMGLSSWICS